MRAVGLRLRNEYLHRQYEIVQTKERAQQGRLAGLENDLAAEQKRTKAAEDTVSRMTITKEQAHAKLERAEGEVHRLQQAELKWKVGKGGTEEAPVGAHMDLKYQKASPTAAAVAGSPAALNKSPATPASPRSPSVRERGSSVAESPESPNRKSVDGQIERALARKKAREDREADLEQSKKEDFKAGLAERKAREVKMKSKLTAGGPPKY